MSNNMDSSSTEIITIGFIIFACLLASIYFTVHPDSNKVTNLDIAKEKCGSVSEIAKLSEDNVKCDDGSIYSFIYYNQ